MAELSPTERPERFGFLLIPRYSMMAFVSALEPLRVANRLAQRPLYSWRILSRDGAPIAASNALSVVADGAAGDTETYDKLVVAASFEPEGGYDAATTRWLRRLDRAGVSLGAIDTGSFVLAEAGLLDGHRATTHWESLDGFAEQFPKVDVGSGLFIIDRTRFTCAGGTAALDMVLHLIRLRHGRQLAEAVSAQFIHARIRDPQERQRDRADGDASGGSAGHRSGLRRRRHVPPAVGTPVPAPLPAVATALLSGSAAATRPRPAAVQRSVCAGDRARLRLRGDRAFLPRLPRLGGAFAQRGTRRPPSGDPAEPKMTSFSVKHMAQMGKKLDRLRTQSAACNRG
jgi:transcriptional regulator GlxA family with amidase domain